MALPNPVLYILARNDLDSLNPGKLAAQACHAANLAQGVVHSMNQDKRGQEMYDLWRNWAGDRHFGTTIVLEVPFSVLENMSNSQNNGHFNWEDNRPVIYGTVLDPSYPLRDGSVLHLIPLITCGFVFGDKNKFDINSITGTFKLYP